MIDTTEVVDQSTMPTNDEYANCSRQAQHSITVSFFRHHLSSPDVKTHVYSQIIMGVATFKWLPHGLGEKLWEVIKQSYPLGLTAFGGPPVHFKIVSHSSVFKYSNHVKLISIPVPR